MKASRGLREHDDGTETKVTCPIMTSQLCVLGRSVQRNSVVSALVATVLFVLLS